MMRIKRKKKEIVNVAALFINTEGKAMSGSVYDRRFKKVRQQFENELLKAGRFDDYDFIKDSRWGSHVGRGIFTNFLFDMGLTVTQIAIARGDTSIFSALKYVDHQLTTKALKEIIEELNKVPLKNRGIIDLSGAPRDWRGKFR